MIYDAFLGSLNNQGRQHSCMASADWIIIMLHAGNIQKDARTTLQQCHEAWQRRKILPENAQPASSLLDTPFEVSLVYGKTQGPLCRLAPLTLGVFHTLEHLRPWPGSMDACLMFEQRLMLDQAHYTYRLLGVLSRSMSFPASRCRLRHGLIAPADASNDRF